MRLCLIIAASTYIHTAVFCFAEESQKGKPFGLTQRIPWTASRIKGSPEPPSPYRTERVFPKLKFNEPLEMAVVPLPGSDGVLNDELFVSERYGKIVHYDPAIEKVETFLDLGKVIYGFALHPKFDQYGQVFVAYVMDAAKEEPRGTRVSRFYLGPFDQVDKDTEKIILEWPSGGHNGGCLRFGPDGYLYIATGDSSGIADGLLTGQDLSDLSGSILRIDVDRPSGDKPYSVPPDNPFVGREGARGEIWAYGLRQPWKFHFDRATGDLWTGNVGQDLWEQIFLIERGGNYGWSVMEGSHPFRPERPRGPTPFLAPIVEHDHADFRSITGGTVYHGSRLAALRGAYVYADYDTGKIWSFRYDRQKKSVSDWRELVDSSLRIVGFGEDTAGELYLIDHVGGGLHRLVPNTTKDTAADFPRKLSETGLFTSTKSHELTPGVLRYSVIAPQWCDGATKERFFGLPGQSQIEFETMTYPQPAPGSLPGWKFPDGTVIAETLSLEMEQGNPNSERKLETRLLHYEQLPGSEEVGDQFWRAYTYAWNDEQTDAELVGVGGADRTFTIADQNAPGGKRSHTWHFPSRAECVVCHNMAAKYVLGLNTIQGNRDFEYGSATDNQLRAFDHIGLFTKPLPKLPAELPKLVSYSASSSDLDSQARSYLHANCSHCHRKWGGGNTEFQLLATLDLKELGIAGVRPAHGGFYLSDAEILAPDDPYRSVLLYRMAKLGPGRMPRLGSDVVDDQGLKLIHDWIDSLPSSNKVPLTSTSDWRYDRFLAALLVASGMFETDPSQLSIDETLIDRLLRSTRGALILALALNDGGKRNTVRKIVADKSMAFPESHIRDLFERWVPEEQRPKRLGAAIKPDVLLGMKGTADGGRRLFFENAGVQCRNCHKIQGQGTDVGPELSQIGKKYDRAKILENILEPSREIDPKFVVHLAQTADGKLHSGILVERTADTIVLKDAKNNLIRLPASEVEQLAPQQQSLMPDLLLRDMTAEQVADLLAFLSELK
jgi:uncharacterized repeat protein (TIGR03806 family)